MPASLGMKPILLPGLRLRPSRPADVRNSRTRTVKRFMTRLQGDGTDVVVKLTHDGRRGGGCQAASAARRSAQRLLASFMTATAIKRAPVRLSRQLAGT